MIVHEETRESLSQRLSTLRRPLPASLATLVDNAAAIADGAPAAIPSRTRTRPRHRTRRRLAQLTSVAAMVGANAGALYYAPVYGDTLRHVPGLDRLVQFSGLAPQDFSAIDVSTEHDGVRLHVSAGYADENQTVLVLDYQGPARGSLPLTFDDMSLHDQFGHSYAARESGWGLKQLSGGRAGIISGFVAFAPITGPAASVGARLTLDASRTRHPHPSWSLDFVLERRSAEHVSLLGGRLPGVQYRFSKLTITPGAGSGGKALVELDWSARGPAVRSAVEKDQADHSFGADNPQPGDNPFAYAPAVVDSRGNQMTLVPAFGFSSDAGGDTVSGRYSYVLGAGTYRVMVDDASGGGFTRTFGVG